MKESSLSLPEWKREVSSVCKPSTRQLAYERATAGDLRWPENEGRN